MVTDTISITELSRLTGKSRPTIYKWLTLYENGSISELPKRICELFDLITGRGSKKDIYQFCEVNFYDGASGDGSDILREIIELLTGNKDKLDLNKIKQFISEEIENG